MSPLVLRPFTADDGPVVAALQLGSWRTAYRGFLLDAYLDGAAHADRHALWAGRVRTLDDRHLGLIAELEGTPVGFAFVLGNEDPVLGSLLDNLHVLAESRGSGVGRALLGAVAREAARRGWSRGLYLHVYEANAAARRFYERHGARLVSSAPRVVSDGRKLPVCCYAWDDAAVLAAAPPLS